MAKRAARRAKSLPRSVPTDRTPRSMASSSSRKHPAPTPSTIHATKASALQDRSRFVQVYVRCLQYVVATDWPQILVRAGTPIPCQGRLGGIVKGLNAS